MNFNIENWRIINLKNKLKLEPLEEIRRMAYRYILLITAKTLINTVI